VTDEAPEAGDLVWIDVSPTSGTEQSGRRPALVISDGMFNRASGRAVVLPVTARQKGFPFEIALPPDDKIAGAALADQVRTIDWRARYAKKAGAVEGPLLAEARAKVCRIIGL
jgi:mRNA interferase MazF